MQLPKLFKTSLVHINHEMYSRSCDFLYLYSAHILSSWRFTMQIISYTIQNLYNSQIKLNQIKCWFLERGENRSTRRKTSRSKEENKKTQPTYDAESGNRTQDTLVEGERSHPCSPYLLPLPIDARNFSGDVTVRPSVRTSTSLYKPK